MQYKVSDASDNSKDEANSQATQSIKPFHKDEKGQANASEEKPKNGEMGKREGPVVTVDLIKCYVVETEKKVKELLAQQANNCSKRAHQIQMKSRAIIMIVGVFKGVPVSIMEVVH